MASNGALGRLNVALGLDATEFTSGLNKADYMSKQSMDKIAKNAAIAGAAIGAAFTAAAGVMAVMIKKSIDNMDAMAKLAQSTGTTVEALSALTYAAGLSDVSQESLGAAMVKLTKNMSDAAMGTGDAKDAFAAMGLSATDASGKLKASDTMMGELAGKFADYKDGAEKTALAVAIFGRAGAQMIPMLNSGKDGLAQMSDEAKRFGVVFNTEAAKAAEKFNDNLTRLDSIQQGWINNVTAQVLPQLNAFVELLVDGASETDGLTGSINGLTRSNAMPDWLDATGIGMARLVDVVIALGNAVGAVTGSFKVVFADIDLALKSTAALNPVNMLNPLFDSKKAAAELALSVKERNDTLIAANKAFDDLWNKPANKFEQAWLKGREKTAFDRAFVGPMAPGVQALAPNIVKPVTTKGGKAKREERLYVATNLDEMLVRMGEATEWLDAYEIKSDKTFDKVGEFALEAARSIQNSLGDGLYDILSGNFDDMGAKFGQTVMRMAADAAAANLAGALFGDYDKSGKVGGFVGDIISSIWPGTAPIDSVGPGFNLNAGMGSTGAAWGTQYAFASGGYTGPGGKYEPAGIVHKGEYVLNQGATQRMGVATLDRINKGYANGGLVGGGSAGGGAPSVSLNIINNSGQPVSASQPKVSMDAMGRLVVDVMLDDLRRNGPYARQLRSA